MTGLPDPQPGHRWVIDTTGEPARRSRRAWPWVVAFVVVAVLVVVAWFAGNWLAKDIVERTIRTGVIDTLELPDDQQLDVEVEGWVLPQLIGGTLDSVDIAGRDVVFGELSGDVSVSAQDVPVRGDEPLGAVAATIELDEAQLRTLLGTVDGFPVDTISLDAPDVAATIELTVLGAGIPVGVALTPSAAEGDIVLEPASLIVGGAVVTADGLRQQFGGIADAALRSWNVCIAEWIPSGVTLTQLQVSGSSVVADFDVDGSIAVDESLQQPGLCA